MFHKMMCLRAFTFAFGFFFVPTVISQLPVIIWHGMGDHASADTTSVLRQWIQDMYPGRYVKGIKIGDTEFEDKENSFLMPIDEQISQVCNDLLNDSRFSEGIHMIGLSQGGLFVRALAQRCNFKRIGAVVSIGGPQQGIFGIPKCPETEEPFLCRFLRAFLTYEAYSDIVQSHLVQAQYWHDPLREKLYADKCKFLPDVNQEKTINETYRNNLKRVAALVLVKFMNDTILVPRESEWFGYYLPNTTERLYDLKASPLYKEDRLGLKALDESGRLHLLETPGEHLQFGRKWFLDQIVIPFLK